MHYKLTKVFFFILLNTLQTWLTFHFFPTPHKFFIYPLSPPTLAGEPMQNIYPWKASETDSHGAGFGKAVTKICLHYNTYLYKSLPVK